MPAPLIDPQFAYAVNVADQIVDIYATDDEEFSAPEERGEQALALMAALTPAQLQSMVTYLAERVAEFSELNFTEVPRPASFTVYADDGEYTAEAENIVIALADFKTQHPRSFVLAIVDDAMRPRLVLECEREDERSLGQRLGDEMNEPTYTPGLDD
jgi:hypothetical protein